MLRESKLSLWNGGRDRRPGYVCVHQPSARLRRQPQQGELDAMAAA